MPIVALADVVGGQALAVPALLVVYETVAYAEHRRALQVRS